jgi:hypothetical protein
MRKTGGIREEKEGDISQATKGAFGHKDMP